MPSAAFRELLRLADFCLFDSILAWKLDCYFEQVILGGRYFGRCIEHLSSVVAQICYICIHCCEAADCAKGIGQIKIAEAVPVVRAVDENVRTAFKEADGIQRLDPGVVVFREYGTDIAAIGHLVLVKPHVMLAAVYNLCVNILFVRAPGKVGDVTFFGKVIYIQPNGAIFLEIINADFQKLRIHTVHGVFNELQLSGAGLDIQDREIRDVGLVFSVIGQFDMGRRPFKALCKAKLVSHGSAAVNNIGTL